MIKLQAFTSYEDGLMKCLACDKYIESCRCVWSAIRSLQENIRKCVSFDLIHSNERNNELFHKAILEAHNNVQAQVDSFGLMLVRLERQIEFGLPSVGQLNKTVNECLKQNEVTQLEHDHEMLLQAYKELEAKFKALTEASPRNQRLVKEMQDSHATDAKEYMGGVCL